MKINLIDDKDFAICCPSIVFLAIGMKMYSPRLLLKRQKFLLARTNLMLIRMAFAFRQLGKGYKAMPNFSLFMNMPPPMAKACFTKINAKLLKAYSTVVEQNI